MDDKTLYQSNKTNNWLLQHRKNITSQFGEDGILEQIFAILPDRDRWCVEFGASDGRVHSNTHHLINNKDWSSVQIESNSVLYPVLEQKYTDNEKVICKNRIVSFEGEHTLDNILKETSIPLDFDFLSIDVDGVDYYIWESLEVYRPKVVVIEFNPSIPHHVAFIQPKNQDICQGCSLLALQQLSKQKNYELIASTDVNGFFVDKQYFSLFGIQDNSLWQMNQNYQYWTHIFQLYDGTIVIGGNDELIWHKIKVDLAETQKNIQVLPSENREYPYRLFDK